MMGDTIPCDETDATKHPFGAGGLAIFTKSMKNEAVLHTIDCYHTALPSICPPCFASAPPSASATASVSGPTALAVIEYQQHPVQAALY